MSTTIIVGAQWGDEGKGKVVDVLTEKADVVVRFQGGNNAGHTVVIKEEKYILHLIPSGVLHRGKRCVIGNGVVVDPAALIQEMDVLAARDVSVQGGLFISKNAHIIMPYHVAMDLASEQTKGKKKIGTTGRGIGPCYTDKVARRGIRAMDLLEPVSFKEKLSENLARVNFLLENYHKAPRLDEEAIYEDYLHYTERIKELITDTDILVNNAIDDGEKVLFEGAQGTLLDVDHGTYPFVTSSNTVAGGACTGAGIGPTKINQVIGVVKAYTTRVGEGPFPTEIFDALGECLRQRGGEFGATTGRPRRCGWLDIVGLRYAIRINGLTGIALTKLDILDGLDSIKLCIGYSYNGAAHDHFPREMEVLCSCTPIYEEMEGWKESTVGIRKFDQLPLNARRYIKRVEELLKTEIQIISTGQKRDEIIIVREPF